MSVDANCLTILLVEDDPAVGAVASAALEDAGFDVLFVKTDDEAFAALDLNIGEDLAGLVTDVNLRCARTGWDVATRARELNPNLPVVYMSGDDGHDWASRGVPNSTLIAKPFVPAQIVVALATLMNKSDADG